MPRLPDKPNPAHRLDRYAFRAGELRSPDGSDTGHVLVLPIVFWTKIGGHLWWRRWGSSMTTADVLSSARDVEPSFQCGWYWGDVLDEMLDLWDAGQVQVGEDLMYEVRWLNDRDYEAIARGVFDRHLIKSVWGGHRYPVQPDAGVPKALTASPAGVP